MKLKDRLGEAIVLMSIATLWTALLMFAGWLTFQWMVDSFGREVAVVTVFAIGGVVMAIILWIASSRHTTAIWRSALRYAADTQEMNVDALRGLSAVQREEARRLRIREQIDLAAYRTALKDSKNINMPPPLTWMQNGAGPAGQGDDDIAWVE